jgi:phenylpropionate dioxygenase-like ring-hydroxylating dioxygenase large terminal subunit
MAGRRDDNIAAYFSRSMSMGAEESIRDIRKGGYGSDERPLQGTLWERDSRQQTIALIEHGNTVPDNRKIDYQRFYDQDYFKLELERLWLKTWLFAARDEDIPNVGDRVPFHVGPLSFIIVRSAENEIKAFYNACLHRGTMLCSKHENSDRIRCPYHGWEWNNDGTLKRIVGHWDFTELNRSNASLREVKVGRWAGFIYINADPNCSPFEEALQVVPEHFKGFMLEERYTAARHRTLVLANWKVAQEAFMESYHLYQTHPEAVPYNGDSQTKYDVWSSAGGCVGRNSTPSAVPSMNAEPGANLVDACRMFVQGMRDWHYPHETLPEITADRDPRAQAADWYRAVVERNTGHKIDFPDGIMIDSLLYFVFPHSTIWLSEALPFTYQFTPHPTDPEKCYWEVRMLLLPEKGKPRPPAAPAVEVFPGEKIFEKAPGFGILGYVFDQDMGNMPLVQKGLRASDPAQHYAFLGRYQERLIQQWHALFDKYQAMK